MKLTIDNMTIEGTVEECYEFYQKETQLKMQIQSEKDKIRQKEMERWIKDIQKTPITPQPMIPYQPPTYIGTPVVPYEPNRILCGNKEDVIVFSKILNGYVSMEEYSKLI